MRFSGYRHASTAVNASSIVSLHDEPVVVTSLFPSVDLSEVVASPVFKNWVSAIDNRFKAGFPTDHLAIDI